MKEIVIFPIEVDGWENEDDLPDLLTDKEYNSMFPTSKVIDGVRMFPYIRVKSNKFYLGRVSIKEKR